MFVPPPVPPFISLWFACRAIGESAGRARCSRGDQQPIGEPRLLATLVRAGATRSITAVGLAGSVPERNSTASRLASSTAKFAPY